MNGNNLFVEDVESAPRNIGWEATAPSFDKKLSFNTTNSEADRCHVTKVGQ